MSFILLLLLAAAPPASAQLGRSLEGTSAGQFLRLAPGARGAALGEAYAAVADEASAVYWNPAALMQVPGRSLAATHAEYVEDIRYDCLAVAARGGRVAAGAGVQYLDAGAIVRTDDSAAVIGRFHPYDLAATLAGAVAPWGADGLAVGAAGKYVHSQLSRSAETASADFGLLSPWLLGRRLRFAAAAQNLFGRLRFLSESDRLPVSYRLAARLSPSPSWTLSAEGVAAGDMGPYAGAGVEWGAPALERVRLALRGGFSSRAFDGLPGWRGASAGLGLQLLQAERPSWRPGEGPPSLSFDYAFVPLGELGQVHRVSATLQWGAGEDGVRRERRKKRLRTPDWKWWTDGAP